jgi:hypothetical protein
MLIKLGEFKGMKEHFEFSEFDKHADSENEYSEFDELSLHKSIELFANNHIYIYIFWFCQCLSRRPPSHPRHLLDFTVCIVCIATSLSELLSWLSDLSLASILVGASS